MYSFIRNDKHSFTEWSRIYDVYNGDGEIETSLVVGYDQTINEYFICYHAIERFNDYYGYISMKKLAIYTIQQSNL